MLDEPYTRSLAQVVAEEKRDQGVQLMQPAGALADGIQARAILVPSSP